MPAGQMEMLANEIFFRVPPNKSPPWIIDGHTPIQQHIQCTSKEVLRDIDRQVKIHYESAIDCIQPVPNFGGRSKCKCKCPAFKVAQQAPIVPPSQKVFEGI